MSIERDNKMYHINIHGLSFNIDLDDWPASLEDIETNLLDWVEAHLMSLPAEEVKEIHSWYTAEECWDSESRPTTGAARKLEENMSSRWRQEMKAADVDLNTINAGCNFGIMGQIS